MQGRQAGAAALRTILSLATVLAAAGSRLAAQTRESLEFDPDRAYLSDKTIFVPFHVVDDDIHPLREAVDGGLIQPDTWLLVMEHDAGRLALVMDQMAYHHVAQGEIRGEPWMVSF